MMRGIFLLSFLAVGTAIAQTPAATSPSEADRAVTSDPPHPQEAKRLFGIVPNFRTAPTLGEYKPISPREKFKIATQDSTDRGTMALGAISAAIGQISNSDPSFGQGVKGYGHRFITSYADYVVGNYMTEAIYPTILHQDPRYFRKGSGGGGNRFLYAVGQIVLTHNDSGKKQFNFSEILGNSTAVAISTSWHPDNRDASSAIVQLGTQLGLDAMSNVMKEFWPEISNKLSRKKKSSLISAPAMEVGSN